MRQRRWCAAMAALAVLYGGIPVAAHAQTGTAPAQDGVRMQDGARMQDGVRVSLDRDMAVILPHAVMGELEALLLHDDRARVAAAVRELIARHGRESPMLAEAIRRVAARSRAGGADDAPAGTTPLGAATVSLDPPSGNRPSTVDGADGNDAVPAGARPGSRPASSRDWQGRLARSTFASDRAIARRRQAGAEIRSVREARPADGSSDLAGWRGADPRGPALAAGDGRGPGHEAARLDRPARALAFGAGPIRRGTPAGLLAPAVGAIGPLLAPVASPVRP